MNVPARMVGAAALLWSLTGCDQDDYRPAEDSSTDTHLDTGTDPGLDTGVDPGTDPGLDPGTDPSLDTGLDPGSDDAGATCEYPGGPYGFNAEGDIVGPMSWPSAEAGAGESLPADLAVLHCDPGVHSIFVQITTTSCVYCPARLAEIAGLEDHWNTYGAKWIFVVADAADAAQADTYVDSHGPTFGWRTHDGDNTLAIDAIAASSIYGGVPWTGVIRTSDMQLVHDEPDTSYLDIRAIAVELAE
jgi:hypothetical protein